MSAPSSMPSMSIQPNSTPGNSDQLAIIALGANLDSPLGGPAATIRAAVVELQAMGPVQLSSLQRTVPANCPPGSPDFVNAVALLELERDCPALDLLARLQAIEQQFGRRREANQPVNAPRPLDLDLISFAGQRINSAQLTLPHPRAHQRQFVLAPLAELAPDLVLPGFTVTVQALLAALPADPNLAQ